MISGWKFICAGHVLETLSSTLPNVLFITLPTSKCIEHSAFYNGACYLVLPNHPKSDYSGSARRNSRHPKANHHECRPGVGESRVDWPTGSHNTWSAGPHRGISRMAIAWSGPASLLTCPKHTHKKRIRPGMVTYITDALPRRGHTRGTATGGSEAIIGGRRHIFVEDNGWCSPGGCHDPEEHQYYRVSIASDVFMRKSQPGIFPWPVRVFRQQIRSVEWGPIRLCAEIL